MPDTELFELIAENRRIVEETRGLRERAEALLHNDCQKTSRGKVRG